MADNLFKKIILKLSWGIFVFVIVLTGASCIRIGIGHGPGTKIEKTEKIRIVEIEVTEKKIFIDKKECKDAAALVKEINSICSKNGTDKVKFVLKNNFAIKSVYSSVKKALGKCEKNLGIKWVEEE